MENFHGLLSMSEVESLALGKNKLS